MIPLTQEAGLLNDIPEFPDVTPERQPEKRFEEAVGSLPGAPVLSTEFSQKMAGQQRNVGQTRPKRRNFQLDDIEPVIEVFTELSALHQPFQGLIGGGNNAYVNLSLTRLAQASDGALLEHAQQTGLMLQRHRGDLVQEEGAPVGGLDEARLVRFRPP